MASLRSSASAVRVRGPIRRDSGAPKTSIFLITLNTNWQPRTDAAAQAVADDLHNAIDRTFTDEDTFRSIINFRDGALRDFSQILSVDVDASEEVGPRTGFLHAHVLLKITHTVGGRGLHLYIDRLKRAIQQNGTTPQVRALPYINVHASSDGEKLAAYLHKGDPRDDDDTIQKFAATGSL